MHLCVPRELVDIADGCLDEHKAEAIRLHPHEFALESIPALIDASEIVLEALAFDGDDVLEALDGVVAGYQAGLSDVGHASGSHWKDPRPFLSVVDQHDELDGLGGDGVVSALWRRWAATPYR